MKWLKQCPEEVWASVVFRKSDGVVHLHIFYKILWVGNDIGTGGVGILLSEEWIENIFDINRVSDRIKLAIDNKIIMVLCHASQVGLDNIIKDIFHDQLQDRVRKVGAAETLVM